MTPEEFEKLCQNIGARVEDVSRAVGQGIASAGSALGDAIDRATKEAQQQGAQGTGTAPAQGNTLPSQIGQTVGNIQRHVQQRVNDNIQQYNQVQAQKAQSQLMKTRFKSPGGSTASGAVMAGWGGIGTLAFGGSAIVGLTDLVAGMAPLSWAAGEVICCIATALFAWLTVAGIGRIRLGSLLATFRRIVGTREVFDINELASRAQLSKAQTVAALRKMIARGLIPQGRIDDDETYLILTDNAYNHYLQARREQQRKQLEADERTRAQEQARLQQRRQQMLQSRELAALPAPAQDFIITGEEYLEQMRTLDRDIDDEAVSAKIVALTGVCERIIARVKDAPATVDGLGRMSDYYLPTTIKLLTAYDDLEDQPIQGDNIAKSRRDIEQTLDILQNAFEKLLDETYSDLSLDVSSDISVLQAILAQEGLTGADFKTDDTLGIAGASANGASGTSASDASDTDDPDPFNLYSR